MIEAGFDWVREAPPRPDDGCAARAAARQAQLTKPRGSLGELETLAVRLAALQGRERPRAERVHISLFAADHGVCDEGVSAFPQAVTQQMLRNFADGGAAICVLARELDAHLEVIDVGTLGSPDPVPGVIVDRAGSGTANFCHAPAMGDAQLAAALAAGRAAAGRAAAGGADLFVGGEMGIGNTTAATALASVLLDLDPRALAGPGTGLDAAGVARKGEVVRAALARHRLDGDDPLAALAAVGGFEIAALAGAYLAAAQQGIATVVDGFIAGSAALAACRLQPGLQAWLFFAHRSAEPGHGPLLEALGARPLLDLGMRLGEGSAAALAVRLLRSACALHAGMATFAAAGVSGGGDAG